MVFKSGLVTRLESISSWLSSSKYICAQPFTKNNINSITSILSRSPTPLVSPLSPWKYWFLTLHLQFFPSILILTVISRLNSDWALLTHSWTMTFWLSNTQNMTQFSFKLIVFSFYSTLKLQLFWNNKAIYTHLACNILCLTMIQDQDTNTGPS